jgi:hypothetical protein
LCALAAFSLGVCIGTRKVQGPSSPSTVPVKTPQVNSAEAPIAEDELTMFWQFLSDETINYNGYVIEKRLKSIPGEREAQAYVVLSKNGHVIQSFDGMAYHSLGNSVGFGLFDFLGTNRQQLAITQDVNRGGVQWLVDLTPTPRVVFDGRAWQVGREGADCYIQDIDGDGVFEISLPITDFYELMDKMSISGIPLPGITFKYDPQKRKYLPANRFLRSDGSNSFEQADKANELSFRSVVLRDMLELIYQGKRDQAWQYFNSTYNLNDKKEVERRVKTILRNQPVYKYIYKNQ